MARRSFNRYPKRAFARTRVVVQKVYSRRRKSLSFIQKNKTLVTVGVLAVGGFLFKDKIKALLNK